MTTQNNIDVSFPLSIANGGTGSTQSKNLLQVATSTISLTSGTTNIPFDNTIPQITEGFQVGTITFSPVSASSNLEIWTMINVNCAGAASTYAFSVFRDGASDAIYTNFALSGAGVNMGYTMVINHIITSGSTSSTTFTFRVGGNSASAVTVNGYNTAAIYGGTSVTPIIIMEYEQ